uniref:Transmembrane protein n=1 Tax=Heterorhabditis bacteriophora TaxID=37862 RepID=A0A1I7WG40_HETBA
MIFDNIYDFWHTFRTISVNLSQITSLFICNINFFPILLELYFIFILSINISLNCNLQYANCKQGNEIYVFGCPVLVWIKIQCALVNEVGRSFPVCFPFGSHNLILVKHRACDHSEWHHFVDECHSYSLYPRSIHCPSSQDHLVLLFFLLTIFIIFNYLSLLFIYHIFTISFHSYALNLSDLLYLCYMNYIIFIIISYICYIGIVEIIMEFSATSECLNNVKKITFEITHVHTGCKIYIYIYKLTC